MFQFTQQILSCTTMFLSAQYNDNILLICNLWNGFSPHQVTQQVFYPMQVLLGLSLHLLVLGTKMTEEGLQSLP